MLTALDVIQAKGHWEIPFMAFRRNQIVDSLRSWLQIP
jgi:hypothetical protein